MKASAKRRRSKKQIEEEKKQEELRQSEIERKLQEHEEMQNRLNELRDGAGQVDQARNLIQELQAEGLIFNGADGQLMAA